MTHHPFGKILGNHEQFSKNVEAHCAQLNTAQAEPAHDPLDIRVEQAAARSDESKRRLAEALATEAEEKAKVQKLIYAARGFLVSLALLLLAAIVLAKYRHTADRDAMMFALYGILLSSAGVAFTFPGVSVAYYRLLSMDKYNGKHLMLVSVAKGVLYLVALIGFAFLLSFLGGRLAAL